MTECIQFANSIPQLAPCPDRVCTMQMLAMPAPADGGWNNFGAWEISYALLTWQHVCRSQSPGARPRLRPVREPGYVTVSHIYIHCTSTRSNIARIHRTITVYEYYSSSELSKDRIGSLRRYLRRAQFEARLQRL